MTADYRAAIDRHWSRPGLGAAILAALETAGKNLDALTVEDLAPLDQARAGGIADTRTLAHKAELRPGMRVLDVGGGLGGPARTLAVEFGCDVTVIDLTQDYMEAGELLTTRLRLGDRVRFQYGNALELPFADGTFDVVWTQNSGMHIEDKAALYRGFHRVLRPAGRLALQEPAAGRNGPPHFPLFWANDPSMSFLLTPAAVRSVIVAAGFTELVWEAITARPPRLAPAPNQPAATLQQLTMGERLTEIQRVGNQNWEEERIAAVEGVFERVP